MTPASKWLRFLSVVRTYHRHSPHTHPMPATHPHHSFPVQYLSSSNFHLHLHLTATAQELHLI